MAPEMIRIASIGGAEYRRPECHVTDHSSAKHDHMRAANDVHVGSKEI